MTENDIEEDITVEEIQEDIEAINTMKEESIEPAKKKRLRNEPAKNAVAKRKHKIKIQKESRKTNRVK